MWINRLQEYWNWEMTKKLSSANPHAFYLLQVDRSEKLRILRSLSIMIERHLVEKTIRIKLISERSRLLLRRNRE